MSVSVRKATIHDLDALNDLATQTFYETYAWYNTPANMEEYTRTHFNRQRTRQDLSETENVFFLAFDHLQLIGYAKMRRTKTPPALEGERAIEIERIYVLEKYQKQKAGYALVQQCIEEARQQKLSTVWLGVWKKNSKALAFYERVGFRIFGSQVFQLGDDPQDDHLMRYDL